jgi:hypothetical protein
MAERPRSNRAAILGAAFGGITLFLTGIGWQTDRLKYIARAQDLATRLSAREDPIPDPSGSSPSVPSGSSPYNGDTIANGPTGNGSIRNQNPSPDPGHIVKGRREWVVETSEGPFRCWRVKTGMACAGPGIVLGGNPGSGATGDTTGSTLATGDTTASTEAETPTQSPPRR